MSLTQPSFAPVAASTRVPIRLAMQRLWLTGQLLPMGGRLVVRHVFRSQEDRPLEAIYSFPLPRDAALRGFRIAADGFEAHSELRQTEEAVKAYERGIADGSLSALARQYGDGLVNLTAGNIRPGETVTVFLEILAGVESRDDGFRFRFPFTLAPTYHAKLRVAVTEGDVELELPADEFGDLILPRLREDASSLHQIGFELSLPRHLSLTEIGSPSHSIHVTRDAAGPERVSLATEKDVPNRDLVLDVKFARNEVQMVAGPDGGGKRSFAAVVPSTLFGHATGTPRRIVFLLDRSGSMQGEPIAQARKAIEACLAALAEEDTFGLVVFDDVAEAMRPGLVAATREHRECARAFLKQADARGGTELAQGVQQAAQLLEGGGDILIITDGQVSGTEKKLAQARATGVRLSCLGIGSASQDRFLSLLARETGGVSRFVTARERVDMAAVELFASMGRPLASGLKASGDVQPEPPAAVFAGTPVVLYGEVESDSTRRVHLTWDGGDLDLDVPPGDAETGATARLLRGSRLITDWESRYPSEEALAPLERRRQSRVAARLQELSEMYGLASREMSLVAVMKRPGDRSGELPVTRVAPVGWAQDIAIGSYRGGKQMAFAQVPNVPVLQGVADLSEVVRRSLRAESGPPMRFSRTPLYSGAGAPYSPPGQVKDTNGDLVELAMMLEPDGGMPGDNSGVRAGRTIAAVFAFAAEGHTLTSGAFRLHVTRLVSYLKSLTVSSERESRLIEKALDAASSGKAPASKGTWAALARESHTGWKEIEKELK